MNQIRWPWPPGGLSLYISRVWYRWPGYHLALRTTIWLVRWSRVHLIQALAIQGLRLPGGHGRGFQYRPRSSSWGGFATARFQRMLRAAALHARTNLWIWCHDGCSERGSPYSHAAQGEGDRVRKTEK